MLLAGEIEFLYATAANRGVNSLILQVCTLGCAWSQNHTLFGR